MYVEELAGESANIIFGAMYDDSNPDSATITVIATGLEEEKKVETPQKPGYAKKPLYQTSVGRQYIQSADRKSCTTFIRSAESVCEETCRYNRQHSDS